MARQMYVVECPFESVKPPSLSANVATFLFEKFEKFGTRIALIDSATKQWLTFNELRRAAERLASSLLSTGVAQPCDRIAVLSLNSANYVVFHLACALISVTCVDINVNVTADELHQMLEIAEITSVMTQGTIEAKVRHAVSKMHHHRREAMKIWNIDTVCEASQTAAGNEEFMLKPRTNDNVAYLFMFSSGTTGPPKTVTISHKSRIAAVHSLSCNKNFVDFTTNDRLLAALPYYHAYLSVIVQHALCCGCTVVMQPKFERKTFLENIEKYRITYLHVVPLVVAFLANDADVAKYDLSSLRSVTASAAPLSPIVAQKMSDRLHIEDVRQLFGMTEVSCVLWPPYGSRNYAAAGVPMPNVRCKIIDSNNGQPLGPNIAGELCLQAPSVIAGYFKNPQGTKELLDTEGWCHTGDLFYYDESGYFYYVGRLKEILKYNGIQVAPVELENLLLKHPAIEDCAVIGKHDEISGDLPVAFVVRKPDTSLADAEVHQFVDERVAPFKRLRGGVRFVNEIPRSSSGKILRNKLKQMLITSSL